MPPPKPPSPRTPIFDTSHYGLGDLPGPVRVEVVDDTIWACGGHVSIGRVYRCHEGRWIATTLPFLPNFVLAISATEAISGGSSGYFGRTVDGGATWTQERVPVGGGWLICASRGRAGRVWMGQQGGYVWRAADPKSPFEQVAQVEGSVNTVRQMSATHALVVTERAAHRVHLAKGNVVREPLWVAEREALIDGAIGDRGAIVLVANRGKAWFAKDGTTFRHTDLHAGRLDFDAVFFVDGWFVVLGYDGNVRISRDGTKWTRVVVETDVTRLGGIAAYRGGWLVGAARKDGALSGTLSYLGDPANAPFVPTPPPEKPAREHTFVVAERFALLWATSWASLPDAEKHAAGWMKLAGTLA